MRILHVCTSIDPATGGPANVLARLTRVQAEMLNHDITILTADAPDCVPGVVNPLRELGIDVRQGGPGGGPFCKGPTVASQLQDLIASRDFDVVHCHGIWQHASHCAIATAHKHKVPVIVRTCGMLDPWSLRQGHLKKQAFLALRGRRDLNHASALHFTTETERRLVVPLKLKPRTFTIPNGIDWDEFETLPEPGRFRATHRIPEAAPLITFLSRLHAKKGLDLLVPALAKLNNVTTHLALVGPGDDAYVSELREKVDALGLTDRVIFAGMLSGAARLEPLIDADVFCLPSYQENFGVVVIEAAATGTPVVISDQVNICDDVADAEVGLVVPCEVDALASALQSLVLDDPDTRRRMAENCRPWVERTFKWTRIAEQVDEMYNAVISSSHLPTS